jgi:hypothetical protein
MNLPLLPLRMSNLLPIIAPKRKPITSFRYATGFISLVIELLTNHPRNDLMVNDTTHNALR